MIHPVTGPETSAPATTASVEAPTPTMLAFARPSASSWLAQAIAVPGPPTKDSDPISTPKAGCAPQAIASATPPRFCAARASTVTRQRMMSGLPPAFSAWSFAESPMDVKNTKSSASRIRDPKTTFTSK